MDENIRFISVLDTLIEKGEFKNYVSAAELLGTNKSGISDIKSGRKKVSLELLQSMKLSYPEVDLNWVITGDGEMFIQNSTKDIKQIYEIAGQIKQLADCILHDSSRYNPIPYAINVDSSALLSEASEDYNQKTQLL